MAKHFCWLFNLLLYDRESCFGAFAKHEPVSYTHLDVYKRQAIHSVSTRFSNNPSAWVLLPATVVYACLLYTSTIEVTETNIFVKAVSANGFFYGFQTLLQLLPPDIVKNSAIVKTYSIPSVSIKDKPRFGCLLYTSRCV